MRTTPLDLWTIPPSDALASAVRGRLVISGTSLNRWCLNHRVDRVWATDALKGKRNGPKAVALRELLIAEASRVES